MDEVFNKMNEQDSKIMRLILKKLWIEDFHSFCNSIGGETSFYMDKILRFEADTMTMQFIYNGLLLEDFGNHEDLIPSIGFLYPDNYTKLLKCNTYEELVSCVKHIEVYKEMFDHVPDPNELLKNLQSGKATLTLEDMIFDEQVKMFMNSY